MPSPDTKLSAALLKSLTDATGWTESYVIAQGLVALSHFVTVEESGGYVAAVRQNNPDKMTITRLKISGSR